ncbi:MAG: hypothetical protein V3V18_13275 [Methylococcales bacterium]
MDIKTQRVIAVLGMHRSGTSAISRAMRVFGIELGERLIPPIKDNNSKGFWEDFDILAINIEILNQLEWSWYHLGPINAGHVDFLRKKGILSRAAKVLEQKVGDAPVFGFKDPRVAKLLPFWHVVFEQCKFNVSYIITVRHPLSVAMSLTKRDDLDQTSAYLLWLGHVIPSLSSTANSSRVLVDFDRLIEQPDRELNRIATQLNLTVNSRELHEYKSEFLDKGLQHTVYCTKELDLDNQCPQLVREVYTTLLKVASDQLQLDDSKLLSLVDCWTQELERLSPILNLTDDLTQKLAIASKNLNARNEHINSLKQKVTLRDERIAVLETAVNGRDKQITNLKADIDTRDVRIAELGNNIIIRDKRIEILEWAVSGRDDKIAVFEKKVATLDNRASRLATEIETIKQSMTGKILQKVAWAKNLLGHH